MSFPPARWRLAMDDHRQAATAVLIATGVLAGIYALSASTAMIFAGRSGAEPSDGGSRGVALQAEAMRLPAEREAALKKCDLGSRIERRVCRVLVRAKEERDALRGAYAPDTEP